MSTPRSNSRYDASNDGSWEVSGTTLTINSIGNFIGIPKAANGFEVSTAGQDEPSSREYNMIALSEDGKHMMIEIDIGHGFWTYRLDKLTSDAFFHGDWKIKPEAQSIMVGPAQGSGEWWAITGDQILERACWVNDKYTFKKDGSFMIDHGSETWLENWQTSDQSEACGTPISPFDGANTEMTWEYNPCLLSHDEGLMQLNGVGA